MNDRTLPRPSCSDLKTTEVWQCAPNIIAREFSVAQEKCIRDAIRYGACVIGDHRLPSFESLPTLVVHASKHVVTTKIELKAGAA
jgi:hypothetical protein